MNPDSPALSILIPFRSGQERALRNTLDTLCYLPYGPMQIVVVLLDTQKATGEQCLQGSEYPDFLTVLEKTADSLLWLKAIQGEYFSILPPGDFYHASWFLHWRKELCFFPDLDALFCNFFAYDPKTRKYEKPPLYSPEIQKQKPTTPFWYFKTHGLPFSFLNDQNFAFSPTVLSSVLYRKSFVLEEMGESPDLFSISFLYRALFSAKKILAIPAFDLYTQSLSDLSATPWDLDIRFILDFLEKNDKIDPYIEMFSYHCLEFFRRTLSFIPHKGEKEKFVDAFSPLWDRMRNYGLAYIFHTPKDFYNILRKQGIRRSFS